MNRVAVFIFGITSYVIFLLTFLYSFGWVGNLFVPQSIDSTPSVSIGYAFLVNSILLVVFSIQHSVMARPAFKSWLTKFIPSAAERSMYVLFSSLALILLMWLWQPMGGIVWDIENSTARGVMRALFVGGWFIVLAATLLINHFDLFGLRQVWLHLRQQEYTNLRFSTPSLYKHVRHPLYVGWLLAFWATPTMTVAHLLFALLTTAYILVAVRLEERDLMKHHPEYADYRRRVPMLIPRFIKSRIESQAPAALEEIS